jgi:hypothetical protein
LKKVRFWRKADIGYGFVLSRNALRLPRCLPAPVVDVPPRAHQFKAVRFRKDQKRPAGERTRKTWRTADQFGLPGSATGFAAATLVKTSTEGTASIPRAESSYAGC